METEFQGSKKENRTISVEAIAVVELRGTAVPGAAAGFKVYFWRDRTTYEVDNGGGE